MDLMQDSDHAKLKSFFNNYFELRNYKHVLKIGEKQLNSSKSSSGSSTRALVWIRAFVALAHYKLGNMEESLRLLTRVVQKDRPTEVYYMKRLLNVAALQLGQYQLLLDAYTYACSQVTKGRDAVELKLQLFSLHIQMQNFQGAAKEAGAIRKLAAEAGDKATAARFPYVGAKCVLLQVTRGSAPDMMLTLASRVLDTLEIKTANHLQLLSEVLVAQGDTAKVLELFDGDLGAQIFESESDRLLRLCQLLQGDDKHLDRIQAARRSLLELSAADDWQLWRDYLSASTETADSAAFVDQIRQANPLARGPRLAKLDLEATPALLLEYWEQFGHKGCFWEDVSLYVKKGSLTLDLVDQMASSIGDIEWHQRYPLGDADTPLKDLWPVDRHYEDRDGNEAGRVVQWSQQDKERQSQIVRWVSIEKLRQTLAAPQSRPTKELIKEYQASCTLYRQHLEATDPGPNDDLPLIVFQRLHRADASLVDSIDATALLELVLRNTPHNPQAKLGLIDTYSQFGAFSCALKAFESLEIKNVLCESLAYLTLYPALQMDSLEVLETALSYRDESICSSVPQYLANCFKNDQLAEVEGFLRLLDRQRHSYTGFLCGVEAALRSVLQGLTPEYVHKARKDGGCSAVAGDDMWLENLLERIDEYKGTAEDMSICDNSDYRAFQKYSMDAVTSAQDRRDQEYLVSPKNLQWLRGRILFFLALESAALRKTSEGDSPAVSFSSRISALEKCWKNGAAPRDSHNWGSTASYAAILAMMRATQQVLQLSGKPLKSVDCSVVSASIAEASLALVSLDSLVTPGNGRLLHNASFCVLQCVPAALFLARLWKGCFPNQGKLKKLPADQRKVFRSVAKQAQTLCKKWAAFCESLESLSVEKLDVSSSAIPELLVDQRTKVIDKIHDSCTAQLAEFAKRAAVLKEAFKTVKV